MAKAVVAKAKAKVRKPAKESPSVFELSSMLLESTLEDARNEYNDSAIAAVGDMGSTIIGIEMPFVMQYVLQNNVVPLGKIFEIVGEEKSNKSALAFEIVRWFAMAGGLGYLFENESKFFEDFACSIIGYPDESRKMLMHIPSESQEAWQMRVTHTVKDIKTKMIKGLTAVRNGKKVQIAKPIGRTIPIAMILDSLAGAVAEENVTKIDSRGFAGRNHPAEALSNSQYFKKFRADLVKWPFSFFIVNHLRKKKAEKGPHIERSSPGGKLVAFQQTFQLELAKTKALGYVDSRDNAVALKVKGNRINIQCRRSSYGEERRSIDVDLIWWYDKAADGSIRQRTKWQWEAAIIDLLMAQEGGASAKIRDIVDVRLLKGKYWSKRLNVKKESPVSKAELGELIAADKEIIEALSDLFAIKRRVVMRAGDDYKKMLGDLVSKTKKNLEV